MQLASAGRRAPRREAAGSRRSSRTTVRSSTCSAPMPWTRRRDLPPLEPGTPRGMVVAERLARALALSRQVAAGAIAAVLGCRWARLGSARGSRNWHRIPARHRHPRGAAGGPRHPRRRAPALPARAAGARARGRTWSAARPGCWSTCTWTSSPAGGVSSSVPVATRRAPAACCDRISTSWPRRSTATWVSSSSSAPAPGPSRPDVELTRGEKVRRPTRVPSATSSARWPRACVSTWPRSSGWCRRRASSSSSTSPRCRPSWPGASRPCPGYGHLRPVDPQTVADGLREVLAAATDAAATVVHCCDPGIPLPLLRSTGVGAVSFDTTALTPQRWESDRRDDRAGRRAVGGVPADRRQRHRRAAAARGGTGVARRGLPTASLADLVATPACGLAGLTPEGAWRVQRAAVDVAAEWSERAES